MSTAPICSSAVCKQEFSGTCNPPKNEGSSKSLCVNNLCENNGECRTQRGTPAYNKCVIPLQQGKGVPETNDCSCNNEDDDSATIDIYFWNNTNDNLSIVGECMPQENQQSLNWILMGKHYGRCAVGVWQIPPPCSVSPGEAFFARGYSENHRNGDDCKHDARYHICLTYGVDGKEENSVTISMCRQRTGSGKNRKCNNFDRVSDRNCQQSCSRGNLGLSIKNLNRSGGKRTRASYQFIVTGGSVVPTTCTNNPDNCPSGKYCDEFSKCVPGCKTNPDSCTSPQICDASSRLCKTPDICSADSDCQKDEFCKDGICVNGCVNSDNCSTGKSCISGVCTAKSPNGNGGKLSTGTIVILVATGIVILLLIIGAFLYFGREQSKSSG